MDQIDKKSTVIRTYTKYAQPRAASSLELSLCKVMSLKCKGGVGC